MAGERQYCDIVMKGGITSGIVYPSAVLALAEKYRFKNIGGTSAGAIAAAAAAAAALGERRRELEPGRSAGSDSGIPGLRRVAAQLGEQGFIYSLFQPARGAESIYWLVVLLAAKPSRITALAALVRAVALGAPVVAASTALALLGCAWLVGGWRGLIAAAVPSLVCTLVAAAIGTMVKTAAMLRHNRLGLCSGMTAKGGKAGGKPGLTEWLHQVLQRLAGSGDEVLTFQHLWDAGRYPGEPATGKAIQLAMITTSVSHHEPRTLPFEKGRFWFREDEFRALFPSAVVDSMIRGEPNVVGGHRFFMLPAAGALPVVVATRMSLSFPLLISAVPLYEPDYRAIRAARAPGEEASAGAGGGSPASAANASQTRSALGATEALATGGDQGDDPPEFLRVCWFSDGGIASNFPIHLFDAALPRWPTFALNLTYPATDDAHRPDVFLPTENKQGWQRIYSPLKTSSAIAEISSFVFAIVATMQNWRDLLQSRAPGHRDRIVHIALGGDEGGMNLNMSGDVLARIAGKGTAAGQKLVEDFNFGNHWWVRWRNVAAASEQFFQEFEVGSGAPISADYAAAQSSAATGEPDPPAYKFQVGQRAEAQARFHHLREDGASWADHDPGLAKGAPNPRPLLRITPTF